MAIRTDHGLVEVSARAGLMTGQRRDGVAIFRGIPDAEAPIGNLRFDADRVDFWTGRAGSSVAPISTGGAK